MQSATAECASSSSSTASSRRSSFSLAEFYQLVQSALDHPASGFPDQLALSLAPVPEHISSPDAPLALVQASSPSFPTNNNTPTSSPPLPAIPLTSHSSFRTTDRGPRRRINIQSRASSASLRPRQMFDRIRKNALSLVHPRTNSTHAPAVRDNAGSPTPPAKEHFHPIPTVSLLASSKNSIYSLNRGDNDDDDADSDFIPYLPLAVQYERAHPHAFSRAPNGSTTSLVRHHSTRSSRLRSSSPTTSTSSGSRTPPASPSHSLDERHSLDSVSTATEPHSPATPRTPQFFTPSHSASSHCDEHLGTARADSPSVVSVDTSSHSHNPVNPNQPPNPGRWSIGPAEAEGVAGAESASQEEDPFAKGSVQIINYYYTPRHPYATASAGADPSPSAGCSAQQVVKRTNFSSPPRKRSRNKNARKEAARKSEPPLLPPPSVPLPDVPGPRTSIGSGVSSAENGSRVGSCSSESTCEWTLRLAVSEGDMRRAGGGGEKIVENSKTSPIILGDTEREKDVSVESEEITRTQSSARGCGSSKSTPPSPGLLTLVYLGLADEAGHQGERAPGLDAVVADFGDFDSGGCGCAS
ncbi:hypothetical protein AX16_000755 [Volvariella volvacea WC 439]|nr:hypothetical protein AX16_000755 [Volvariella volvacea WC 439]